MIEVPLQLVLRPALLAEAYLLLADDAARLAAACARLAARQLPRIHAVAGGYLVIPRNPSLAESFAAIRLRRLGESFYVPVDADLVPALLPDELDGLTRSQGLIVLPGGEVLAFEPEAPLPVSMWLAPPPIVRREWRPFPPRPPRIDKLTIIERPSDTPAAVIESLNAGRPDRAAPLDGNEPIPDAARPPSGSVGQRLGAGAALAAAQLLALAGRLLKSPKLAQLGGKLARKAVEQVPRLTEKILGAQEAALRHILKQLQSGNVEDALRRAPAAFADPDARGSIDTSARLNTVDPRYLLRNLLGGSGGAASTWLGGGDVWNQLAVEYRRLAQEALARGDFRRAAYLYGVLLRDLRSAANALAAGGLHRDAAVLFRDRLHDPQAAATQFERAGDIDEAVRIYDRLECFEQAAELLRRVGDEDRAADYFLRAAQKHTDARRWIAAGDLVRTKLGRRDLAKAHYRRGWDADDSESVLCGQRLIDEYVLSEEWDDVDRLHCEAATDRFLPPRSTDAGRFFNYILKLGERVPASRSESYRDAARGIFAEHLRASPKGPHLAGQLFGSGNPWPPEIVRDALYATRRTDKHEPAAIDEPPVRVTEATVVAIATARVSRDILIATTASVKCWRVADGAVQPVLTIGRRRRVLGVAIDAHATMAAVLYGEGVDLYVRCISLGRNSQFEQDGQIKFDNIPGSGSDWYLKPVIARGQDDAPIITLVNPYGCYSYMGSSLSACTPPFLGVMNSGLLLAEDPEAGIWIWERDGLQFANSGFNSEVIRSPWIPGIPPGSTRTVPAVDWITRKGELDTVGVDSEGVLHWARVTADAGSLSIKHLCGTITDVYTAACLLGPGLVAAATRENRIVWLKVAKESLIAHKPKTAPLGSPAVAVSVCSPQEIAVVLSDGSVSRIRKP